MKTVLFQNSFQTSGSCVFLFQFLMPITFKSSSTDSSHLNFGLPTRRVPSGFWSVNILHGSWSFILKICPNHLILPNLIILHYQGDQINSWLHRALHVSFSLTSPCIFLKIHFSKILSTFPRCFVKVQLSIPYINTGLIRVLHNMHFVCRCKYLDFKSY